MSLSPDSCVRQTESIFERFGATSMVFRQVHPRIRVRSRPALAGAMRLRYPVFVLFDAVGAGLWVGVGVAIGYVFRDAIGDAMATLNSLGHYGLMIVIAAFATWSQ